MRRAREGFPQRESTFGDALCGEYALARLRSLAARHSRSTAVVERAGPAWGTATLAAGIVTGEAVAGADHAASLRRADAVLAEAIGRTTAIGDTIGAILARVDVASPVAAGVLADAALTGVTARTRAIGGAGGAILARARVASAVTAGVLADAVLTGVTGGAGAIVAVGAILAPGTRPVVVADRRRRADPVLTRVTARTCAIGRAVGTVLGSATRPVVVAYGWRRADAVDTGLAGRTGVAARAAVRLVGRFVDTHAAAGRLAFLAARRAGAASRVVVDVRDVSAAGGDGCLGAIGGRQRASVLGIHALPAATRATEDTQAAGEKRWWGGLQPRAAQANAAGRQGLDVDATSHESLRGNRVAEPAEHSWVARVRRPIGVANLRAAGRHGLRGCWLGGKEQQAAKNRHGRCQENAETFLSHWIPPLAHGKRRHGGPLAAAGEAPSRSHGSLLGA